MKTYQIIADVAVPANNWKTQRHEFIMKLPDEVVLTEKKLQFALAYLFLEEDHDWMQWKKHPLITSVHWAELHEPPLAVPQDQRDNGKLACAALGGLNRCTEGHPSPAIHW